MTSEIKTTILPAGKARGINKRIAPMTMTKATKAQKAAGAEDAPTKRTRKPAASKEAPAATKGNTFTSVDLANEHGINAKTLRARIRRNIDKWEPLFKDGKKHVFADNATTRKAVAALLEA